MIGSHGDSSELGGDRPRPESLGRIDGLPATTISRMHEGLAHLLRAYDYAADLECDAWEFAVGFHELNAAGLEASDLRWLTRKSYIEHAVEVTLPGEEGRSFHHPRGLSFRRQTCFVLTLAGATFSRQVCSTARGIHPLQVLPAAADAAPRPQAVPCWSADLQELRYNGALVKQFKVPAPNQEMILAAFEEEGWPPRIDDPLPPQLQQDAKRRLHDTINSLNRNHKLEGIRFMGDGTGEGVRWTRIDRAAS